MTMYHVPSKLEYLFAIEQDGFYDYANELHEGKRLPGVRLSEVPLWELGSPANPVAFAIDLEPESLAAYECSTAYLHGYRQWVVPARIVNQANRTLIPRPAACQEAMGHPADNRWTRYTVAVAQWVRKEAPCSF